LAELVVLGLQFVLESLDEFKVLGAARPLLEQFLELLIFLLQLVEAGRVLLLHESELILELLGPGDLLVH
jgi:hypothetical protein